MMVWLIRLYKGIWVGIGTLCCVYLGIEILKWMFEFPFVLGAFFGFLGGVVVTTVGLTILYFRALVKVKERYGKGLGINDIDVKMDKVMLN